VKAINAIRMGGVDVLPLVEGGKGVAVSNGATAGAWAAAGGVGTFSAVNADSYDAQGEIIRQTYAGKTRRERHEELVEYGIKGGIAQAIEARERGGPNARIHANILWEMGGAERVIRGILDGAKGMVNGITCGAGMPYRLADIAREYGVHYYPIVSSGRAFSALWKRSYSKARELLGGVVYEDPWLAGGHNGLSNSEDPRKPESPFPRVLALRQQMRFQVRGKLAQRFIAQIGFNKIPQQFGIALAIFGQTGGKIAQHHLHRHQHAMFPRLGLLSFTLWVITPRRIVIFWQWRT
jgi:NAD(P)H-dependent flavin oxidoreductase YrpB (nitropropane dioxygenase family)